MRSALIYFLAFGFILAGSFEVAAKFIGDQKIVLTQDNTVVIRGDIDGYSMTDATKAIQKGEGNGRKETK